MQNNSESEILGIFCNPCCANVQEDYHNFVNHYGIDESRIDENKYGIDKFGHPDLRYMILEDIKEIPRFFCTDASAKKM